MENLDLKKLEAAYDRALTLEKAGDLDSSAEAWREVLALDPSDHSGAAVRLASMGRGDPPAKAPEAYVMTLFDQTAEVFDEVLVDHLGYSVPGQLRQLLEERGIAAVARVLDLGCGTGLTGAALRDIAGYLVGADISENMVAMAWDRGIYDELYIGEAVQFLDEEDGEPWCLVTATDVIPYFGDLEPIVLAAARVIATGGYLAFSTETLLDATLADRDWIVGPHRRFAHRASYIHSVLERAGFAQVESRSIIVRYENGEPIAGLLVLARKG